jgi:hypothetical protein
MLLAEARLDHIAAWKVEARSTDEILLTAAATRSWLSVKAKQGGAGTTLLMFGSAVAPARDDGKLYLGFHALLGIHRRYSRWLLKAAARRVASLRHGS